MQTTIYMDDVTGTPMAIRGGRAPVIKHLHNVYRVKSFVHITGTKKPRCQHQKYLTVEETRSIIGGQNLLLFKIA